MRVVVALALAGCFGKPGFSGHDAPAGDDGPGACTPSKPSSPGLMIDTDASNTRVTFLDGSELGFRNVLTRYPMPDRLIVHGQNLVAAPEGCAYEDQVGVAAFPVFTVGAQALPGGSPTHALDAELVGPAFTSFHTRWSMLLPAPCGGTTRAVGDTSWAFLPDGRVVRNDSITPSEMTNIMPGPSCNCSGAVGVGSFLVTSYTTFEASALDAVTRAGDLEGSTVPASSSATRGACARGSAGGKVAVWWDRVDNLDPATPPTRLRHGMNPANGNHDIFAFVYDMVTSADNAMTMTAGTTYGIRTHMMLSAGSLTCVDALGRVESFASAQPIQIGVVGTAGAPISYSAIGVFEDPTQYAAPVTVRGTLAPGFAVHLRFPGFTAVTTTRPANRVVWQRHEDGTFTLFFHDGLDATSPVTISPECPS